MTRLEQGLANTLRTGCDNENGDIISLFYVLFLMLDRMNDGYMEWIDHVCWLSPIICLDILAGPVRAS